MDFKRLRTEMVEKQIAARRIRDPTIASISTRMKSQKTQRNELSLSFDLCRYCRTYRAVARRR